MIIFQLLDECLKYIFFSCINLKQKLFEGGGGGRTGDEVAPAYQVIKKLKKDNLWLYTLYPIPCRNCYRM